MGKKPLRNDSDTQILTLPADVKYLEKVLELLNAGIITATLDRRPYDMGQLAVHLLYQYFNSGIIPPKRILIPPSIITASAAETFNEALYPKISLLTGGIKILPPSDTEQ